MDYLVAHDKVINKAVMLRGLEFEFRWAFRVRHVVVRSPEVAWCKLVGRILENQ